MIVREVDTLLTEPIKLMGHGRIEDIGGLDDALAERIHSRPPSGYRQIFNIYWDPDEEEIVIEVSATDTA